jgi:hypothetical protein
MRNRWKGTLIILAAIALLSLGTMAHKPDSVAELTRRLNAVIEEESARPGSTAVDPETGRRVFVGDSATRVAEASDQAAREYDALRARPPEEREGALAAIRAFAGDAEIEIEYQYTSSNANLSTNPGLEGQCPVEVYYVGDVEYSVDPRTDTVVQMASVIRSMPPPTLSSPEGTAEYSAQESEAQARDFLKEHSACFESVEVELAFQTGEKHSPLDGYTVRFFRWEIPNWQGGGMSPFIQVGVTSRGRVVYYGDFVCGPPVSLGQ